MHILLAIVAIVLSLLCVVGIHEAGHALAAHFLGVKIKQISIGFGKPLLRWRAYGIEWIWARWPLGGYVELLNTRIAPVSKEEQGQCFDKKPIWVRLIILFAGAFANILVAAFALWFMLMLPHREIPPIVDKITVQSAAAKAQLKPGDQLISIDGHPTHSWQEVGMQLLMSLGKTKNAHLIVKNASGEERHTVLDLTHWRYKHKEKKSLFASIGITPASNLNQIKSVPGLSPTEAIYQSIYQIIYLLSFFLIVLKLLFLGIIPFELLLGPLGLFIIMIDSFFQGLVVFLNFIASLSLSVAFVNLFPLPSLDGGSIVYTMIEKIRGKPMSVELEVLLHRLITIALCIVFVQLLMNDLPRLLF
jgi:regulator of sigma E protease